MARVVYGPLVSSVKGSIGGITFQGNPSGSIIRNRPRPTKVSTNRQTASHASLQNLLYLWQQLTQSERDEWNVYATAWTKENKFGQAKVLTGLNWFTSVNYYKLLVDSSTFTSPPAHVLPQAPPSFGLVLSDSAIKINFLEAHLYPENPVAVWASFPTRKNTLSINQVRRLVTILTAQPADPLDITALWKIATGINWDPANNFPNANIYVCLESMSATSFITSSLLCTKQNSTSAESDTLIYYL